jgi:tRNA threonylcarbamoyladenosine modification (KEOPS) complex  Pcc1 subunit
MPNTIDTRITIPEKDTRTTIYDSLIMEKKSADTERAKLEIELNGDDLVIRVIGTDLIATRALFNSIMRLVKTSVDVLDITDNRDS